MVIQNLRWIVGATDLPVTIDLESGYGDTANWSAKRSDWRSTRGPWAVTWKTVFRRVESCARQAIRPGASGALGRRLTRPVFGFFINARTDVFFQRPAEQHDDALVVEVIARAHAYAEAGADGIFAPGLADIALIARLANASPLPVNIMVGDATPPLRALAEHGVARVSHGPRPYLIAMKMLEDGARGAAD